MPFMMLSQMLLTCKVPYKGVLSIACVVHENQDFKLNMLKDSGGFYCFFLYPSLLLPVFVYVCCRDEYLEAP